MPNLSLLSDETTDHGAAARGGMGTAKRKCDSPTWKTLVLLIAAGMVLPGWGFAQAPSAAPAAGAGAQAPIPQDKLDSLLAPIALYPDQLLTQTLMASTYPLDVVAAARFVKENRELKGEALDKVVAEKKWDPSVQSLTGFPQVLEMMNDKLDWMQALGDAFLADKKRVLETVQGLRRKADAAGNLKSNEQVKVIKEQSFIIIEPAQSTVVYVPTYNPTVIYGTWWVPMYPPYYYPPPVYYYPPSSYPPGAMAGAALIGFGLGMAIADNHWNWCHPEWHGGDVNVNIDRNNTFIKNNPEFKNKVNNGNWQHNPAQRKGVSYNDARTRDQYRKSDPGATASRRDARGYDSGTRAAASAGTRDMQHAGGDFDRGGASAATRDMQRGGSDYSRGSSDFNARSNASSSFDSSQSRQQANSFSSRGSASSASMGGGGSSFGGGSAGASSFGGGGRSAGASSFGGGGRSAGGGRGGRR